MNRNKIKFKYLLGVWKTLPEYPTSDDIVYELSLYLLKDGRPHGEFSIQTLRSVFGPSWETNKHGEIIKKMIDAGDFEETKKSSASKKWYRISKTPYY
jgi:hypothetical protein